MSRTLVRYTIPLDSQGRTTHRLGINSLVIDPTHSGILYSGGRDGIISAWDLKMDISQAPSKYDDELNEVTVNNIRGSAAHLRGVQAHTNWVNQIAISSDFRKIYSCSSDTFVKSWRPHSSNNDNPDILGSHGDYVKCLVASRKTDEYVATAGLDRSIIFWDTNGKGERMRIDSNSVDGGMKQSIYSLTSGPDLIVSGGIEKVIRVWDTRSGTRAAKFIGHTDNVRSLMCSEDGKYFISASSDTTIKIWDLTAGRCLHTLTAHSEPVWTLLSDHPQLAVFHAADKSGLLTKTDLRPQAGGRNTSETVAICKESSGINSIAQIGSHLFTATASSSMNRWADHESISSDPFADEADNALVRVDSTRSGTTTGANQTLRRHSSTKQYRKPPKFVLGNRLLTPTIAQPVGQKMTAENSRRVSLWSQASVVSLALEDERTQNLATEILEPINRLPESTIHGQAGLKAHIMLPDRRRVLTRDSDGHVKLWDITHCRQISDFGKVDIAEIEEQLQSPMAIGSWCSINTKVGALTVELDPRNLLDAETYFDAFSSKQDLDFDTRNQRFNIGKWMLKNLFSGLIEAQKAAEFTEATKLKSRKPANLNLGDLSIRSPMEANDTSGTPRGVQSPVFGSRNPYASAMSTPGASFGLATPAPTYNPKTNGTGHQSQGSLSSVGSAKDTMASPTTPGDYFSSPHGSKDPDATPLGNEPQTNSSLPKTPGGSNLMKNMKWLRSSKTPKTPSADTRKVPVAVSSTATTPDMQAPNVQKPPLNYKEFVALQRKLFLQIKKDPVQTSSETRSSWIVPSEPLPELQIPPNVGLSIAIFKPGEGEAKDIYRGEVGTIGDDLGNISEHLPVWLAQILLLNELPPEMQNIESNKHYFSFVPLTSSKLPDPFNTSPPNLMRLGAARSLRIRKALTYISQRLPAELVSREGQGKKEEEWLEITVGGSVVDPDWTLLMTRRHLWKQGGDMKLEYKLKHET